MHEQSIVQSLLSVALENAERAQAVKIVSINLVVGAYSGVLKEAVDLYFSFLSKNTIAEGATIVYTHVPAKLRCRDCGAVFSPENLVYRCPECHEPRVDIVAGRELYVDSLEVE